MRKTDLTLDFHIDLSSWDSLLLYNLNLEKKFTAFAIKSAFPNGAAILTAVKAHGGIGLVPDFTAAASLASGRVVSVLPKWEMLEPYAGKIYAVYVPGRHIALKMRALIDFLVVALSK